MATTRYVIQEGSTYLADLIGTHYTWTVSRQGAKRYARAEALATRENLIAAIRARGYRPIRVRILPLTGGTEVTSCAP